MGLYFAGSFLIQLQFISDTMGWRCNFFYQITKCPVILRRHAFSFTVNFPPQAISYILDFYTTVLAFLSDGSLTLKGTCLESDKPRSETIPLTSSPALAFPVKSLTQDGSEIHESSTVHFPQGLSHLSVCTEEILNGFVFCRQFFNLAATYFLHTKLEI